MRFLVQVDLSDVPGLKGKGTIGRFAECGGLSVEYDILPYEEGGQNAFVHKLRGRAKHPNLTLKRGVTNENALMAWFFACKDRAKRKDITLTMLGPDGQPVRQWGFAGAYPSKWTGPTFNAGSNNVATESLEIVHQGFTPVL